MNYLAHVYFSFHEEDLLVGNVVTDMLTLKESRDLAERYQHGIRLHRLIDKVTDEHPLHKEGLKKLYPTQGKYAPVVLDIYYDYFLGKNWPLFSGHPVDDVVTLTYKALNDHLVSMPQRIIPMLNRMIEHDFLNSCLDLVRLEQTFQRLQRRVTFESALHLAVRDLAFMEEELESVFLDFFPEAVEKVAKHFGK